MSKSIKQQLGLSDSNSTNDPIFEAFGICDFSDSSTGKYKKDSIFNVHEQLTHKKVKMLILV
jgi:ACT domain-containing protein